MRIRMLLVDDKGKQLHEDIISLDAPAFRRAKIMSDPDPAHLLVGQVVRIARQMTHIVEIDPDAPRVLLYHTLESGPNGLAMETHEHLWPPDWTICDVVKHVIAACRAVGFPSLSDQARGYGADFDAEAVHAAMKQITCVHTAPIDKAFDHD